MTDLPKAKSHVIPQARLGGLTDNELVSLRAALDVEMRSRKIAVSVGAVGEKVAINHFCRTAGLPKLTAAPTGTMNMDATSRRGDRYSIKTVCQGKKTGTIYPDPIDKEKQLFEYILIVKLAKDWSLESIYEIPWSGFVKVRSWDKRMNAWYVGVSARALAAGKLVYRATEKTL